MERHDKWVAVSPGTVIPAGQPYRREYEGVGRFIEATEHVRTYDHRAEKGTAYFVDSSWRPPLELPTEPTWGIMLLPDWSDEPYLDQFSVRGPRLVAHQCSAQQYPIDLILDFIPLTPEQVARIEAAR